MSVGAAFTTLRHTMPGLKALSLRELATKLEIELRVLQLIEAGSVPAPPYLIAAVLDVVANDPRAVAVMLLTKTMIEGVYREQQPWPEWQ